MAKYQPVSPRFWQDPKVRRWPDHQKLLGAYLLTCPHRTSEGLFWLPHGYVAQDLGWSIERVSEGYSGLKEAGFCAYDDTSETVLLLKALKYQAPAGPKQIQGAISRLADVPPSPLFALLRDAAADYAPEFCKGLDEAFERGLLKHHRYPTDTPPGGYPLARARSSSSSSSSSSTSKINPVVEQARPLAVIPGGFSDDPADILDVWDTWKTSTGKHRCDFSPTRRQAIVKALNRYPLDDVLDAVRGHVNDPWPERPQHVDITQLLHMGTARKPHNTLEKMRDLWRDGPPAIQGKHTTEMVRIAQDMLTHRPRKEASGHDLGRMDRDRAVAQRQLSRPEG
jgi:hypothetical protein